jgi:2-polyprenyl-3-methyl-5-hydroxy-6-metoxy-1,4-benzoquinol methylase
MVFKEHAIRWDDQKISHLWDYYARSPVHATAYFSRVHGAQILRSTGLSRKQPLSILDFGCGPGFLWEHLVRLDARWNYTGIDFSADSVAALSRKGNGDPRFCGAHYVSKLPAPLPAERYDVVLLVEVVEHLREDDLSATLDEAARLMRPNGQLVISTPNAEILEQAVKFCPECGAAFHEWQHLRSWTKESLSRKLAEHGMRPKLLRALDFAAQATIRQWAVGMVRGILGHKPPHLIGVFERQGKTERPKPCGTGASRRFD